MHLLTSKWGSKYKIKELTEGNKQKQKPLVLIGDLNLNSLDYDKSTYENYENK